MRKWTPARPLHLKVASGSVRDEAFEELIRLGVMNEMYRALTKAVGNLATLDDFLTCALPRYLISGQAAAGAGSATTALSADRTLYFPPPVFDLFRASWPVWRPKNWPRSRSKVIKLSRLLRTGRSCSTGEVRVDDLRLLASGRG